MSHVLRRVYPFACVYVGRVSGCLVRVEQLLWAEQVALRVSCPCSRRCVVCVLYVFVSCRSQDGALLWCSGVRSFAVLETKALVVVFACVSLL